MSKLMLNRNMTNLLLSKINYIRSMGFYQDQINDDPLEPPTIQNRYFKQNFCKFREFFSVLKYGIIFYMLKQYQKRNHQSQIDITILKEYGYLSLSLQMTQLPFSLITSTNVPSPIDLILHLSIFLETDRAAKCTIHFLPGIQLVFHVCYLLRFFLMFSVSSQWYINEISGGK